MKSAIHFRRNRFGDYVFGVWCIVNPRFGGRWIITRAGEPRDTAGTLTEAKTKIERVVLT